MRCEFQNLKIAITDAVHLKAVCDVLDSMGYTKSSASIIYPWTKELICREFGLYYNRAYLNNYADTYKKVTLTDLLRMRDTQVIGEINARH